jgi:hypothetical protein
VNTLLLDRATNDLCLDALGNIAIAAQPYAQLQDAASAVRVFAGECWYDTTLGVPYFEQVLNGSTPLPVLRERMAAEARRVPGVADARIVITALAGRALVGQLQISLNDGTTQTADL